mmetsp:Transcript_53290/g.159577  ORF Transcript_53290/g.159577 Transcript_53290/m.159577 type:complete len:178 (-) Transcript_53290:452-985(-)
MAATMQGMAPARPIAARPFSVREDLQRAPMIREALIAGVREERRRFRSASRRGCAPEPEPEPEPWAELELALATTGVESVGVVSVDSTREVLEVAESVADCVTEATIARAEFCLRSALPMDEDDLGDRALSAEPRDDWLAALSRGDSAEFEVGDVASDRAMDGARLDAPDVLVAIVS